MQIKTWENCILCEMSSLSRWLKDKESFLIIATSPYMENVTKSEEKKFTTMSLSASHFILLKATSRHHDDCNVNFFSLFSF